MSGISAEKVKKRIKEEYSLEDVEVFDRCFWEGFGGDSFYLRATGREYVFKISGDQVTEGQAAVIVRVLEALAEKVKVPQVFRARDGGYLRFATSGRERVGILYSFIPNDRLSKFHTQQRHLGEVAREVSRLNRCLGQLETTGVLTRGSLLETGPFLAEQLLSAWRRNPLGLEENSLNHGRNLINRAGEFVQINSGGGCMSREQLVHGDLTRENFLFRNDHLSGLIDFDNVCVGEVADEWAILIASWINLEGSGLSWENGCELIDSIYREVGDRFNQEEFRARAISFLLLLVKKSWKEPRVAGEMEVLRRWYNEAVSKLELLVTE